MDQRGLWRLFFITGLPEAYLALRGVRAQKETGAQGGAKAAFRPEEAAFRKA